MPERSRTLSKSLLSLESPTACPNGSTARAARTVHTTVRTASDLPAVLNGAAAAMAWHGYAAKDVFGVRLALEEALVNALKHGHGYDPAKRALVRYRVTRQHVLAEVVDQGPGFDPSEVADALSPEGLGRSCGRGLLLMRHYLTWVRYNRTGNRVTLCKRRSPPG